MNNTFYICDAKVTAKGQVTIPKKVRDILGIKPNDYVTFIVDRNSVLLTNSSLPAREVSQLLREQLIKNVEPTNKIK